MQQTKNTLPKRIVIYARDVQNIIGKSERTARSVLQKIRKHFNKNNDQYITISEFCQYTGLKENEVEKFMGF